MPGSLPGRASLAVHAVAVSVFALGVVHVVVDADPLVTELSEASILWVFGAATAVIGVRLGRSDPSRPVARRILGYMVGGGLLVGALATTYAGIRLWSGEPTTEVPFMTAIGWSVGVAAGAWTGYYNVRSRSALQEQRDLTKRLTVLQRILRHNLRNEMSVIGGASRDLQALLPEDAERAAEKLETIDRHADAVMEISERSQTLTRIWRTDGDAEVDLAEVLDGAVEGFRRDHPSVPLEVDVPDTVRVRAHPSVGIAVEEVLDNAAEHNEEARVSLRVRGTDSAVAVEVADTGGGIPVSELEPLWAAGEAPLSHTTGLGLWLIYWLVETSGGDLDVESDGRGTTVSMTFERA